MSDREWTPSPDAVPEGHVQVTIYDEPRSERVATVFSSQANVDLVLGAPDLLKACREAVAAWDRMERFPVGIVSAAIAKATGGAS